MPPSRSLRRWFGAPLLLLSLAIAAFGTVRLAHAASVTGPVMSVRAATALLDPSGADLTISLTGTAADQISPTDILWVPGETLTYTLTVRNTTQSLRVCDPAGDGVLKPTCYTELVGAPVSSVVVQDSLPSGVAVQAVSGDSGFGCIAASAVVTCTGGAIAAGGHAQITIVVTLPDAAMAYTLTDTALVNPAQTLSERSYTNNSASLTTTVWFCPPTCIN